MFYSVIKNSHNDSTHTILQIFFLGNVKQDVKRDLIIILIKQTITQMFKFIICDSDTVTCNNKWMKTLKLGHKKLDKSIITLQYMPHSVTKLTLQNGRDF